MRIEILSGLLVILCTTRASAQDAGVPSPLPPMPVSAVARAPEPARPVVEARGGALVTAGDLAHAINARPAPMRGRFIDPNALDQAARDLMRERLLAEEARRTGLERDPAVRSEIDRVLAEAILARAIAQPTAAVTDSAIDAYYAAHLTDMFTEPERVHALAIMVSTEETARRLIGQLRRASEARFRAVARRVSQGRSARQGGDIGWLSQGGPQEAAVIAEALRLHDPGASSTQPVAGSDGEFYIVRVIEREDPHPMPLEGLRRTIRSRILEERRAALVDALVARLARDRAVRVFPAAPLVRVSPMTP